MRLTNMAIGPPHHGMDDSDEEAETAQEYDEEATTKRWYHAAEHGIKWALSAGQYESSTAERGSRSVYSKLETRSSAELDWRDPDVTIVSSYPQYSVLIQCCPLSVFTSHAGALSARSIVLLYLQFPLFFITHLLKSTIPTLPFHTSIIFVAAQLHHILIPTFSTFQPRVSCRSTDNKTYSLRAHYDLSYQKTKPI